jgi:myosin heavy subunit
MPGEQLKEIEDEEQVFQRKTTKLAMEMARSEAEKPMTKALTVESLVRQMQKKMEEMENSFSKEIDRSRSRCNVPIVL